MEFKFRKSIRRRVLDTTYGLLITQLITSLVFSPYAFAATATWDLNTSSEYTYDSNKIEFTGGVASLKTLDFTDDSNDCGGGFGNTTDCSSRFTGTTWDATGYIKINDSNASTNCTDYFTSRVLDAGASVPWNGTISWEPDHPSFKELPNSDGVESAYTSGNISMASNVLLLHANDSAGCSTTADTSGDGNNFTNSGGVCGNAGVFGNALTIDSTGDSFTASPSTMNVTGNEMTVCMWVKARITTHSSWNYFMYTKKGGAAGEQTKYEFGIYGTSMKPKFKVKDNIGTTFDVTASTGISAGNWYHVCGRYSVSLEKVSVFVDGLKRDHGTAPTNGLGSSTYLYYLGGDGGSGFFDGSMDEVAMWSTALTDQQIIDLYKRGASRLKFQVRSCDDDACSGETFAGPNGTGTDFYDETDTNTTGLPSFSLTNVSDNQYFQYKVCMEQDNSTHNTFDPYNPYLESVTIGPTHYDAGDPTVETNNGQAYTTLTSFTETLGGSNQGTVKYQLSDDDGTTWYYHNGSTWVTTTAGSSEANTDSDLTDEKMAAFSDIAGSGTLKLKVYLISSNGTQAVELGNVDVDYTSGPAPGITVGAISGNTTEAGGTATFTIVLDSLPTADVTIGLSSSDTSEGTVSPSSVTFTTVNWSTPQEVTVTGVDDAGVDGNIGYTIVTAAAVSDDTGYNGVNASDVSVTNNDNDTAGFTVSSISGNTTEAGGTATFTVKLTSQPTSDVVISSIASTDTGEGTVSPTTLTFTSVNWNSNQTVTVTGVDDDLDDGNQGFSITLPAATSSDPNYSGANPNDVSVTNTDNDTAGVTVSETSGLVTTEAGVTDTFTIVLDSQPTANVTVGLSSSDTSEGTVSPSSLTFTSENWDDAQTVTVTGQDDDVVDGDQDYTIVTADAASTDGNYNGINPDDVSVTNEDGDTAGVTIAESGGSTNVAEGGAADTYTVILNSEPTDDVVITITSGDGEITVTSPLTFTSDNWDVAQTVTVTAVDDDFAEGNHADTISHTAESTDADYDTDEDLTIDDVTVNITDNETAGVEVSESDDETNISEDGTDDTYSIVLTSEPAADVTITISGNAQATPSPEILTFTADDWDTPQTVTVSAEDDDVVEGNHTATITHSAESDDAGYNEIGISNVTADISDDDSAGVAVSASDGSTIVSETGLTDSYTLVLTSQPTADVSVAVSFDSQVDAAPASLTFTSGNWGTPQTVAVSAEDDDVAEGAHNSTITHSSASGDGNYNGLAVSNIVISITDNDNAGVTVTESGGSTSVDTDGSTDTYTVVLTSQPAADVTITISEEDDVEVSPAILTFTPDNWDTAQTVTVSAGDGAGAGSAAVTHSAESDDSIYDEITINSVSVTITEEEGDDDDDSEGDDDDDADDQPAADAGANQRTNPGAGVTLDGSKSAGTDLTYSWEITSGCGSLISTSDINETITYVAPSTCTGDVIVRLTVTDSDGDNDTDTVVVHVYNGSNAWGVIIEDKLIFSNGKNYVYEEESDEGNVSLLVGDSRIALPEEDNNDYTFDVSGEGYVVIGLPGRDGARGEVYVSTVPDESLSREVNLGAMTTKLGTAGNTVKGVVTTDVTTDFVSLTGNSENDRFGLYVAIADADNNGRDNILIGAPGAGTDGVVYIYSLSFDLIGMVFGSADYTVSSIIASPEGILSGGTEDMFFGPNNKSMGANLRRQEGMSGDDTTGSGLLMVGDSGFVGSIDLETADIDLIINNGTRNQAAAFGDLNGDENADLVIAADNGRVYIYFGPVEGVSSLSTADTVISGGSSGSGFGRSVAVGDVSGDGIADLIVGAPDYGASLTGAVYIFFGDNNWDSLVSASGGNNILVVGENANDQIGSDFFLADTDDNGINEIYTLAGEDVYQINLALSSSDEPEGGDEPEDDGLGGFKMGGGCSISQGKGTARGVVIMLIVMLMPVLVARRYYS